MRAWPALFRKLKTVMYRSGGMAVSYKMTRAVQITERCIWLTRRMMAELYGVSVPAINQHLKKVVEDGELTEDAVIKKYLITAADGKQYLTNAQHTHNPY